MLHAKKKDLVGADQDNAWTTRTTTINNQSEIKFAFHPMLHIKTLRMSIRFPEIGPWKHEMRAGVMDEMKDEATQAPFPSRHTTTVLRSERSIVFSADGISCSNLH